FLRSFMRGSRVSRPACFSGLRYSSLTNRSARAIPCRVASAWPVMPPPHTFTDTSNLPSVSVTSRGCCKVFRTRGRPKYSTASRPLTIMRPVPGTRRTRATAVFRRPVAIYSSKPTGAANPGHLLSAPPNRRPSFFYRSRRSPDGQGKLFRLLGRMRMTRPGVHLQLHQLPPAQARARQHAAHGQPDEPFRTGLPQLARGHPLQATRFGRALEVVHLVVPLGAGQPHLLRVDDDDEVAGVNVRRILGLVLAAQHGRDLRRQTPQRLAG